MKYLINLTLILSIFVRISKIFFGDIIYIINLTPILIGMMIKIYSCKSKSLKINKIDFMIFLFFIFILINLFINSMRGSLSVQLILILYVVVPIIIYYFIRITKYNISIFTKHILTFALFYSLYIIIEFLLYYFVPELKEIVSAYLESIGSQNIYPPNVNYPFIGQANKPWGPMFDTSAAGALLVVIFAFLYDSKQFLSKYSFQITLFIMLIAIFLSGSKTAYLMFLIYLALRTTLYTKTKLTKQKVMFLLIFFFSIAVCIISFINFFFTKELLNWYVYAMIIDPLNKVFCGLFENGIYSFIGSGQENSYYNIFGLSEIDLFNAVFRYGLFSMIVFLSLLVYLILKFKRMYSQFSIMYIMFFISMSHYQVVLKYPSSMIFFISIGVLVNEIEQSKINKIN